MPRIKKTVNLLIALLQAIAIALRLAWIYTRLQVRLALWKRYNRIAFRFKTRGLPASLADELRRDYSKALSNLTPPSIGGLLGPARRPHRRGRGGQQ